MLSGADEQGLQPLGRARLCWERRWSPGMSGWAWAPAPTPPGAGWALRERGSGSATLSDALVLLMVLRWILLGFLANDGAGCTQLEPVSR